ncbi:NmrA family NAD(P)-binding protein [Curtobacterium sp. VKM Ac-1393]|uniref:NAD(P)H-binding protein n=1 Tax=Curtobacterium sp. VKM Ac-1393 TaxID=2783814 RepID=UPI00188D8430|nr:NmrA family NAD(P)-binding protein [Curtobacterium sp. VKM Ac-1393]MBF4606532.1 NmrA family NAD(P)-binding protein [Curtobacterium sp. VKM Ac-1393]
MSIIVTAASGHLGRLVVESLIERGAAPGSVVATSRDVGRIADLAASGVRTAVLDYSRPNTIADVIGAGDVVVLISSDAVGQRVAQHAAVIDAAARAGAGRIIYTSVLDASRSTLVLAPEHKATEEAIAASGVPATILRNGWYTENYATALDIARQSGMLVASVGEGRVASASRRDFAEAAAVVALDDTTAGRVFELSGDTAWTHAELASVLTDLIGSPVRYRALSPDEHAEFLRGAGLDEDTVGFLVALDAGIRDDLLAHTSGELRALIGRPTTTLAAGLAATAAR